MPEESFDKRSRAVPALINPAPPTIRIRIALALSIVPRVISQVLSQLLIPVFENRESYGQRPASGNEAEREVVS
jgi:hypothetical protein